MGRAEGVAEVATEAHCTSHWAAKVSWTAARWDWGYLRAGVVVGRGMSCKN